MNDSYNYFIHIPKNCGSSFSKLIKGGVLKNFKYLWHNRDSSNAPPEKSVLILRDPIDRFISAFYYSKQFYPNCELSKLANLENPSDLVKCLMLDYRNEKLLMDESHNIGKIELGISWVWTPQHYWYNGAKYVLFHHNLENDFSDFLKVTNRPFVKLPHINRSRHIDTHLEDNQIAYLKERYRKDYELIELTSGQEWKGC
jgi:hypothetical protein